MFSVSSTPRPHSSPVWRRILACLIVVAAGQTLLAHADDDQPDKKVDAKARGKVENPFPKAFPAPDLEGGIEWLNVGGPITLKDLRGKVVVLDFWTFCCINCMHVLPDLKFLEQKYGKELVVIGVHSAKFDNEKETGNIRKAILRYEIEHPVINDANMTVWRKFQINSWPSLVLIDPEGNYCGVAPGEGNRELLDTVIGKLIAYHKSKGTLDETPVNFDLERNRAPATPLRFPGKLLVDDANHRLFVSDSNNNRIVVAGLDGKLIDVIGSGAIGSKDGSYSEAQFDHPQGMTLVGDTLYIADTENHQLRTVDLAKREVATLGGTGKQASFRAGGGRLNKTELNSPWDLCVVDGVLYIAMAGPHQLWSHKLGTNLIQPYAGSGREDITDGALDSGALAQPSGIASDGHVLYVVDSEGSALRRITTRPKQDLADPVGEIKTIAGTHDLPRGASLFAFGDIDGAGDAARFQHPLGIVLHKGVVFVADSYNHKIRMVDLKTSTVSTFLGTGKPGTGLDPVQFAEPAGMAISGDNLYVADTNNHRLVVVNLQDKKAKELVIEGLRPPKPVTQESADTNTRLVAIETQKLTVDAGISFQVDFKLPDGFKLNPLLPVKYKVATEGNSTLVPAEHQNVRSEATTEGDSATFKVPVSKKTGSGTLLVSVTYGYCRDGKGGLCKVDTIKFKVPVELGAGPSALVTLNAEPK
ncbi:MAG: redoxin domain-containing protein [Planctomycetes bacterium]|nr:redoxin domain-containing protein [Planctomycetota bacterium]